MPTISDATLDEMVKAIAEEVDPLQVILFGSHARGESDDESDIDFLIVQDPPSGVGPRRRTQMAKLWRRLARYPVSQDFLIHTPEEVAQWRNDTNHVIARALREGKTVYTRG